MWRHRHSKSRSFDFLRCAPVDQDDRVVLDISYETVETALVYVVRGENFDRGVAGQLGIDDQNGANLAAGER